MKSLFEKFMILIWQHWKVLAKNWKIRVVEVLLPFFIVLFYVYIWECITFYTPRGTTFVSSEEKIHISPSKAWLTKLVCGSINKNESEIEIHSNRAALMKKLDGEANNTKRIAIEFDDVLPVQYILCIHFFQSGFYISYTKSLNFIFSSDGWFYLIN